MSYFAPIAPISYEEQERRLENVVNRIQRHCRIGKVTAKPVYAQMPKLSDMLGGLRVRQTYPPLMNSPGQIEYMQGCGCKVGQSCGNVACPHRLVATS